MSVMTTNAEQTPREGTLSQVDLAELLAGFNEAASRLHATHEKLQGEVARLRGELRAANEQVERSRRLAALGEMAAGIAHEVRNPLGSIRLYAKMLEEDLAGQEQESALARKITGVTRVVEGIVGDVLNFSKEFKPRVQEAEAQELFARSLEVCQHDGVAGSREVRARMDVAPGASVWCDAALMQQVLVNLIRNAMEAMHEGKSGERTLVLTARKARLRMAEGAGAGVPAEGTAILVQDSGPGVTPEVVERMFNPFFTTRGQGTGLGLAIVHRIIDAHGGRVRVFNNSDVRAGEAGACVEVFLPDGPDAPRVARAHVRVQGISVDQQLEGRGSALGFGVDAGGSGVVQASLRGAR